MDWWCGTAHIFGPANHVSLSLSLSLFYLILKIHIEL